MSRWRHCPRVRFLDIACRLYVSTACCQSRAHPPVYDRQRQIALLPRALVQALWKHHTIHEQETKETACHWEFVHTPGRFVDAITSQVFS
jgi:hypothetical protein